MKNIKLKRRKIIKANKKTLMAVKHFLSEESGSWDKDGMIKEIAHETKLLKHRDMGDNTLSMDECGIEWDGDNICNLDDFINSFSNILIEKFCNVLDSFVDEDISCYFEEE